MASLLIFIKQINGNLHGSMKQKKLHETQVDGSIHAVSIDPGLEHHLLDTFQQKV